MLQRKRRADPHSLSVEGRRGFAILGLANVAAALILWLLFLGTGWGHVRAPGPIALSSGAPTP